MADDSGASVKQKLLWAAVATAVSLLVQGYVYELSPNVQQTAPFIASFMDPALFPADAYVRSAEFFPSLFPRLLAWAGRLVPLYPLHFLLFLVFRFFMFYITAELGLFFFGTRAAALWGLALTVISPLTSYVTFLGEDPLMKNSFFPTSAAAPLVLTSLLLFLKGRIVPAFALAGFTYYINGLPVNYLLAAFACVTVMAESRREYFKGWAVFFAVAAPWLFWYAWLGAHNPYGGASPDYDGLLRYWYSGHYFMSAWPARRIAQAVIYTAFAGYFIKRALGAQRPGSAFLKALCVAFSLCVAAGFVFSDLVPVRTLITLQLYRADSLFYAVALIIAGGYFCGLFRREGGVFKTILLLNVFSTHLYAGLAVVCAGIIILDELEVAPVWRNKLVAALAVTGAAGGFWAAASSPNPLHCAVFGAICALLALDRLTGAFASRPSSQRAKLAAAVVAAALPLMPLGISNIMMHGRTNKDNDWRAVQLWARDNTPVRARFLTPPGENGFRVFSNRSPVVEWLDAAAMHWTPGFEKPWYQKIEAVSELQKSPEARPDKQMQAEYLGPVSAQSLIRAAAVTRADYLVTLYSLNGFPAPPVYSNKTFAVYRTADFFGSL